MIKSPFRLLSFLFISFLSVTLVPNIAYAGAPDIGDVIENLYVSMERLPNILTTIAFISGIFLAITGVMKLKDHVDTPSGPSATPISAGIKRLLAGAFFIALPITTEVLQGSLFGVLNPEIGQSAKGWKFSGGSGGSGLADLAILFISSFAGPMKFLTISFAFISGLAFILIGISRLIKTAQDGPRGPTGVGTIITFLVGSALINLGMSMGVFTSSLFGDNQMSNYVVLDVKATKALSVAEKTQLEDVISSILMFVSIIGFIAFVRGMYVLKAVADGNQQVSMTQAFTFLLGGALAVNLGDVINMIQATAGATILGFSFT